jgi:predicted ABC-type ATPase
MPTLLTTYLLRLKKIRVNLWFKTINERNKMKVEAKNCVIVAGPNGSGKTTFAKAYLEIYAYEYVNADDIAFQLNPEQPEKVRIHAGRLFFEKLSALIEQGKELLIETTLSGQGFKRIMSRLRQTGYIITIIFIFLENPDVCIARVEQRVRNGGHHVPASDIIRRFRRSKENFWHVCKDGADFWYLFYNSGEYFQQVAIGESSRYLINNEEVFSLFLQEIKS